MLTTTIDANEVMPGTQRLGYILSHFGDVAMRGGAGSPCWWLRRLGGTVAPGLADWRCYETRGGGVFVEPGSGIQVDDGDAGSKHLSAEGAGLLVSLLAAAWLVRVYPLHRQRSRDLLQKLSEFAVGHGEYGTLVLAVFSIGARFGTDARATAEMLCAKLAVAAAAHDRAASSETAEAAAA